MINPLFYKENPVSKYVGRVGVTIFGNAVGDSITDAFSPAQKGQVTAKQAGQGSADERELDYVQVTAQKRGVGADGVTQTVALQVETQSVAGSVSVGDELPPGYTRTSEGRIIEEVVVTGRYTGNDPSVLAGNDLGALAYGRAFLNEVYGEVEDRAVARGGFLNYALARTGRNVGNFAFGLAETAVAVVNDPKSGLVGAFKSIPNFGPEVANAGINLAKLSANGLTLLAEELPGVPRGAFEGFRASDPYNITPLLTYNNQAEQGGALLANLAIGAGLAKYGSAALQSPVLIEARLGEAYTGVPIRFRSPLKPDYQPTIPGGVRGDLDANLSGRRATSETSPTFREENDVADLFASEGYRVEQQPKLTVAQREAFGIPSRDPDYLIEGRPFDLYSPSSNDVRNIASGIADKANPLERQADRVIVDLRSTAVTRRELEQYVRKNPISGLNELRAVTKDSFGNTVIRTVQRQ